ncbi:hypothetical protein [Winogradskyella sp.]|uniref:tetratricopeptide repeat protein n=1 Tax=Winogradskyella sp. TaxID=1883156 RepID=UPI00262A376F|nr:hypothetical protein [Winogradskyella sp.]
MSPEVKKKWINTLKFFAAYLVAAWTFLQFVDWVLIRYNISPHWVDILLWFFIGISPSLIIYLYHQERLSKRIVKLREKIFIPLNFIILFIGLYFGFGNTDLGATTKEINYTDEQGEAQTKTITKEEFRIGIPIFNFDQINKDSTTTWLQWGIGQLLNEDLLQNKNLSPEYLGEANTSDKIRTASLFYDYYVDGNYQKVGDDYEITVHVRKATNGKSLNKQTFKGPDVLKLLDDISVFITSSLGFVESNKLNYIDLPISEFMSNSLPAIEAYVSNNYTKAYNIDETFALAYLEEAKISTAFNKGKLETQDITDKAFTYKSKLPLQKQLEVYIQRSLAYDNYDEAEAQVKLQLEVDPSNDFYNNVLFSIYGETKNVEGYLKASEALFRKDPSNESGLSLGTASLVSGNDDEFLKALAPFELINPDLKILKLEPLILKGDIKKAEAIFEEYKLAEPRNTNRFRAYDSIFKFYKNNTPKVENLEQFVGTYRSGVNEQMIDFWINGDRLVQYVKNQSMRPLVSAGPEAVGGGFLLGDTFYSKLIKSETNGKVIGISAYQFFWRITDNRIYWKLDDDIIAANEAFEMNNIEEAIGLYEVAIASNPKHGYLPNILSHLKYTQNKDKDSLLMQHQKFAGSYGPRKFWVEDGKFYYKRKGEDSELSKVELLSVSENRYMDLTRLGTMMAFEKDPSGKMASNSYSFIIGEDLVFEWRVSDNNDSVTNYFLKDD